jgi:hypothetical protein
MDLHAISRALHPRRSVAVRTVARLGFAAKGLVAVLVGAVALRLALGHGGRILGPKGVLPVLLSEPFGRALLAVIAAGLLAHGMWKALQALADPEDKGTGFAAMMERISYGLTSLGYLLLAWVAVQLLLGNPVGGGGLDRLAARALRPHFGRWAVGLIGAVVIVASAVQLRFGAQAGFRHVLQLDRMSRTVRLAAIAVGVAGYMALSLLSALVGYFFVQVALHYDPAAAGGWSDALSFLVAFQHGRWLLGGAAAGIICYGLYFLLQVEYRQF